MTNQDVIHIKSQLATIIDNQARINQNIGMVLSRLEQLQSNAHSTLDNGNKQTEELRNLVPIIKQIAQDVRK